MKTKIRLFFSQLIVAFLLPVIFLMPQVYAAENVKESERNLIVITISGQVVDAATGEPLPGVNVAVRGRVTGAATRSDGSFSFTASGNPPITLVVSLVGFQTKEVEINQSEVTDLVIELEEQAILGSDVVVSASRVEQDILRSPVTINKMDILTIRNTPSANFYDAIADVQGVQMNTSGMTFKSINTRGFATIANTRFVQLIDGMDNAPPGLNFPAGNLIGISELDVESMELVPGAASALYGPNAFNGILLINGKSPFVHQGLSILARSGATSQRNINRSAGENVFYDVAVRYARQVNDRFAFKINAAAFEGTDWHAADLRDIDTNPLNADVRGSRETNPSFNALNKYGSGVATTMNLDNLAGTPAGTFGSIHVSRTGYEEPDLVDYDAESYKLDTSLHYRLTDNLEAIYQYRLGAGTGIYQGFSRNYLENIMLQYHKIELKGSNFFVRAYGAFEDAGDSYDSRFLAWNINRTWKPDQQWFGEYAQTYIGAISAGANEQQAHQAARQAADTGRLIPGTPEFNEVRSEIQNLADLQTGSKFVDESNMLHAEGNYDFSPHFDFLDVQIGGNVRQFNLDSKGTIFNDGPGSGFEDGIGIFEWGAYLQASRSLLDNRLDITGSIRVDQNENFDAQFSPRASAVFSLDRQGNHNLRGSFQTGFRNPDTQNQFIALDLGPALLLGGTERNIDNIARQTTLQNGSTADVTGRIGYNNAFTLSSVQEFAATENPGALRLANTDFVQPEQIRSVEFGYKGLWENRFMVDLIFYHNWYNDFQIGRNVVAIPEDRGTAGDISGILAVANGDFKIFQLNTNSEEQVSSVGFTVDLDYLLPRGYRIGGSYSFADFSVDGRVSPDTESGFNTPKHRFNLSLGNRNLTDRLGFNLSFRWSDSYFWESTFAVGDIPSYNVTDLQFTYRIPDMNANIKVGGSNIFNQNHATAFGGPQVGGQYYLSVQFDNLFR